MERAGNNPNASIMKSLETDDLLNLEWRAVIQTIEADNDLSSLLTTGGTLKVAGHAECAEAWIRERMAEVDGKVIRLDLEGWEPSAPDLHGFLSYQSAVTGLGREGLEEPEVEEPMAEQASEDEGDADGQDRASKNSALSAAAAYAQLFADPSASAPTFDPTSAELTAVLDRVAGAGPLAVVVPGGDFLPEGLRQNLASVCAAGSGKLWVDIWPSDAEDAQLRARLSLTDSPHTEELLRRLGEACPQPLRNALAHWALLLGDNPSSAPLEPVLATLGLDDDSREQMIDTVDDELVEGEALEVLRDLQFLHPSFRDSVYRPSHALWPALLLHGISDDDRRKMARTLLTGLRHRLQRGRGAFAILLRLAEPAGDQEAADRLRLRLRWWSDSRDLKVTIERALGSGILTSDQLWTLAGESNWPPHHRLAFLDAWQEADGHPSREGDAEMLRAEILHLAEDLPEALNAIRRSLEIQGLNHGTKSKSYLAALHLCALLLAEADELEVALEQMQACVELASELLPEDDDKRLMILENYGKMLVRGGRLRLARAPFEQVLAWTEQKRGADHPATAIQRNNLAGLLLEMGELQLARKELERAMRVFEATFGPRSMELYGALRNLAKVADELRDDEQSLALLERLAPLEESLVGPNHPALLSTWTRLAELRRDTGDRDGARFLFERSLELAVEIFYGDHPSIPALEQALEDLR